MRAEFVCRKLNYEKILISFFILWKLLLDILLIILKIDICFLDEIRKNRMFKLFDCTRQPEKNY